MYVVTKRIEFCYGHRLLDYDGVCKHPHGHNAVAEIDVRTDQLDSRNMVADFSDIKRLVKGWIDRELDHKMILREDDPLVAPLRQLGEPMFLLESRAIATARVDLGVAPSVVNHRARRGRRGVLATCGSGHAGKAGVRITERTEDTRAHVDGYCFRVFRRSVIQPRYARCPLTSPTPCGRP
jgi:6-pyruvoyltetrahydropterin/6-carboxytetrahydropterin synthase